ncbi:hypothetical protein D1007_43014 [Hordeum vulgare]|nr:hypothetical protein D1007_43014 [Hordeum vulgare]
MDRRTVSTLFSRKLQGFSSCQLMSWPSAEAFLVGVSLRSSSLSVGVRRDMPASDAARQHSYAKALLAPFLGNRSARRVDYYIFPHVPVEMDLLAAMLSARPVGIDPWHNDPMLDEAMPPSTQVLPVIIGPVDCPAWDDDMWLTHGALSVGNEEYVDPMCSEASFGRQALAAP